MNIKTFNFVGKNQSTTEAPQKERIVAHDQEEEDEGIIYNNKTCGFYYYLCVGVFRYCN